MGPVAQDNEIRILDLATGRDRAVLWVEGVFFRSLAFSPDGRHLATSLTDGTVRVYDAATGRERLPRPGRGPSVGPPPPHDSKEYRAWLEVVDCLAFSPDGSILAGGSSQAAMTPSPGSLYLWDFSRGRELRRIDGFRTGPGWLSFAPDGRTIASAGSWEPITRLWDVATGREAFPQPGHVMGISTLAVSPADGTVFTGSYDGTVRQWDPSTGRELGLVGRFNSVLTMAIAPDGKTLLVGGHFGDPALLSVAERREIRRIPGVHKEGTVHHVAYSRDGRTVAFQGQIWDAASGRPLPTLRAPDEPREGVAHGNLLYTPDGKRVITVDPEVIRTWDIASGTEVAPAIRGGAILSDHVALSADGRFLATSGYPRSEGMMQSPPDPWIRVLELATGREVARLPAHEKSASGVALSPDGRLLASFRPNDPDQLPDRLRAPAAGPDDPGLGRGHGPRAAPARGAPGDRQRGRLHARRPLADLGRPAPPPWSGTSPDLQGRIHRCQGRSGRDHVRPAAEFERRFSSLTFGPADPYNSGICEGSPPHSRLPCSASTTSIPIPSMTSSSASS